jgi:cold shock protein
MKKGKVKFFNESKGYGFINDSESGEDIFVHSTGLKDEIRDGDSVVFEVTPGKRGMNAVNVRIDS